MTTSPATAAIVIQKARINYVNHFMQHLETKLEKVSFKRVDADVLDKLIEKDDEFWQGLNTHKHNL